MEYMDRIKECISVALRDSPCTFEEIVRGCYGAYPLQVKQVMDQMNIHNRLVPLFTTNEIDAPFDVDIAIDYYKRELVTFKIENNPILSSWYFSWHTCAKIAQLDLWQDQSILFLGTPRLFEYFACQGRAKHITLVDFDEIVTTELIHKYGGKKTVTIEKKDINFLGNIDSEKFDCIFLDPPWYIDSYLSWLRIASQLIKPEGKIMFPLFPYLLRPTASQERNDIFQLARKVSKLVLSVPEFLEYDISSFERMELVRSDIHLLANWKIADLMVLQGVNYTTEAWKETTVDTSYLFWVEYEWFGIRWFVKCEQESQLDINEQSVPLIQLFSKSVYLKSPSRQNPELRQANVTSSEGHGFVVNNTERFIIIMNDLNAGDFESDDFSEYHRNVMRKHNVDEKSRDIFLTIEESI